MVKTEDVVLAIFGSTSALSALVLVFLGLVASTLGSLRAEASAAVKRRYKVSGAVSFAAFMAGLACAGLSIWWLTLHQPHHVYAAVVVIFLLQLALLALAAGQAVIQMIFRQ
jgi:fatty-acid desaturase